ncbi:B12-binding domain-containing radical SAM protein [Candidatus Woesearchaeota archaeon]|nr:B12-binding domain-containing radical SAM protein [Candidatus Woesearchaeota archaeon]
MSDVILVYPKTGNDVKNATVELPLSLLSIAGSLKTEGYNVKFIDARLDDNWQGHLEKELSAHPLLVCVSSMTGLQIKYALDVSKFVKENTPNGIKVLWGGAHATLMPHQTVQHDMIDAIVIGEGEIPIVNTAKALENGSDLEQVKDIAFKKKDGTIIFTPKGELPDVNQLPDLAYDLVNVEEYVKSGGTNMQRSLPFVTSRGCPYRCTFCSTPSMTRFKWRPMNADLAYERVSKLVQKYKLDFIRFYDENFTSNPQRANELADRINGDFKWYIQARMDNLLLFDLNRLEKNGLSIVQPGVESGSDRILQMIHKGEGVDTMMKANRKLAETGIQAHYNFMMGFPTETYEEVMQTVDLALKFIEENKNAYIAGLYVFTPYLGTPLFDFAVQNGFKVPQDLEGWSDFYRQSVSCNPWAMERMEMFQNIAMTSKLVDGKYMKQYFSNTKIPKFIFDAVSWHYKRKWKKHEFKRDTGVKILEYYTRKKFGWV